MNEVSINDIVKLYIKKQRDNKKAKEKLEKMTTEGETFEILGVQYKVVSAYKI